MAVVSVARDSFQNFPTFLDVNTSVTKIKIVKFQGKTRVLFL